MGPNASWVKEDMSCLGTIGQQMSEPREFGVELPISIQKQDVQSVISKEDRKAICRRNGTGKEWLFVVLLQWWNKLETQLCRWGEEWSLQRQLFSFFSFLRRSRCKETAVKRFQSLPTLEAKRQGIPGVSSAGDKGDGVILPSCFISRTAGRYCCCYFNFYSTKAGRQLRVVKLFPCGK